jgi:hypothetical protein
MNNPDGMSSPLPESFLGRVLQEFGLQWTQVAIFAGAAFSSLRLTPYLDPAVWMLVTGGSFALIYIFRRQISGSFPRVAVFSGLLLLMLIGVPLAIALSRGVQITRVLSSNRVPWTVYIAFSVIVPFACAMISYRKQESMFGGPYPKVIQEAIAVQLAEQNFYREDQVYALEVAALTRTSLVLRTALSYTVVNRTKTQQKYTAAFVKTGTKTKYISATIGDLAINVKDPDYLKERGLFIDRTLPPSGRLYCAFVAEEAFPVRYSELFTAYAPATSLTIRLKNPYTDIDFDFESLLPEKVDPTGEDDALVCRTVGGVLPFQGFRLHWTRTRTPATRVSPSPPALPPPRPALSPPPLAR